MDTPVLHWYHFNFLCRTSLLQYLINIYYEELQKDIHYLCFAQDQINSLEHTHLPQLKFSSAEAKDSFHKTKSCFFQEKDWFISWFSFILKFLVSLIELGIGSVILK